MRSRVIIIMSSGRIRFLRSASRSSATVLAATPARRALRGGGLRGAGRRLARLLLAAARLAALASRRPCAWRRCCCDDGLRRSSGGGASSLDSIATSLSPSSPTCSAARSLLPPLALAMTTPPCRVARTIARTGRDGSVIGEPDAQPVGLDQLALARARSRRGRSTTSRPRASRWSIAPGRWARRGRSARAAPRTARARARAQVEVAAEHERVAARPVERRAGGARSPRRPPGAGRPADRVQVGDAHAARVRQLDPRPQHPAPLRPPGERQLRGARAIRPGWRTRSWFEPPSLDAIRSGFQSASAPCTGGQQLREVSTRTPLAPGAPRELAEPARRRLLEQRDVPLEAVEHARELVQQRAVDLRVSGVALGHAAAAASAA